MPNWVRHDLTITGPETERERFMAECFSQYKDTIHFDFDRLIPQPEHIKDEPDVEIPLRGDISGSKRPAWYDWRCQNWGTKWNACHSRVEREAATIFLSFDTAWSPPSPIFNEIAKRFPTLKIEGELIEEFHDFGGNILCQNGNVEFEDKSEEIRSEFETAMKNAEQEGNRP